MKIVMVITSYHPIVGGAERQLAQLAARLTAAGHRITVVTRHHAGLPLVGHVDGVLVRRIPASGPKPLAALRFLWGAARAVRSEAPDVIHCHSLHSPVLAGLLARGMGAKAPVIAKPLCAGEATHIAGKPLGGLRMALMRRGLARLVSISGEITDEALALGFERGRIAFVPNGVDCGRFRPDATGTVGQALPSGLRFVFAGRFAVQKRLPLLLRAFARVAAVHPGAQLLIAGANRRAGDGASVGGEDESADLGPLLAHPRVHVLGQVDDMPALLAASDVFVLPSAMEGLSNALLEACAAGLATVCTRIGGNLDIVTDGETGLMFDLDDEEGLTDCLMRLAGDAALRDRLGAAARQRVCAAFDIAQTERRLDALYAELAGGKP